MLLIDRVVCDFCYRVVGQLFNFAPENAGLIADQRIPPYFCVCPRCFDLSVIVSDNPSLCDQGV